MKIIICDDEIYIRDTLKQHLKEYYSSLDVLILSASSGEELLRLVEREQGDVFCIFLDIEMEGMDGLETARRLRAEYPALPILLLTSHTELALEGYEVQAFRFLAKPLRQEKLVEALRAVEKSVRTAETHKLRIAAGDREIYVDCRDISYVKSENVYLNIVTTGEESSGQEHGRLLMRGKLKELLTRLPEYIFCQIHRSYIVNLSHVASFDGRNVQMDTGESLPVSGGRREMFRERMTRYLRER